MGPHQILRAVGPKACLISTPASNALLHHCKLVSCNGLFFPFSFPFFFFLESTIVQSKACYRSLLLISNLYSANIYFKIVFKHYLFSPSKCVCNSKKSHTYICLLKSTLPGILFYKIIIEIITETILCSLIQYIHTDNHCNTLCCKKLSSGSK